METVAVVLRVGQDRVEEFEAGSREHAIADTYQVGGALAFGGETVVRLGPEARR